MARRSRIDGPGLTHHVIHRGNNRQRVFFDEVDYRRYCSLLEEGVERFGHEILAFCLMPNHVHLVIRSGATPLSEVVQNVAFRFAMWSNKRRERVGHVFQGRFRSYLVLDEPYLLRLVRYIHQNPVRAGLAPTPADHPWNSHSVYVGESRFPWVASANVLAMFDTDAERARSGYLEWLALSDAELEGPPAATDATNAPESPRRERTRADLSLDSVVRSVARAFAVDLGAMLNDRGRRYWIPRAAVAVLLREGGCVPMRAWAEALRRDPASVSRMVRELERRLLTDTRLAGLLDAARRGAGLPSRDRHSPKC